MDQPHTQKRILIIAAEFPPCGGGGVGRPYALATYLANSGWDVHVLTATTNNYNIYNTAYSLEVENLSIHRVYSPSLLKYRVYTARFIPKLTPYDKYFLWGKLAQYTAIKLQKKYSFNMVFSTYPTLCNHYIGYKIYEKFNVPWVTDYRDPPRWMYNGSKPKHFGFYNKILKSASKIIVTSNKIEELMLFYVDNKQKNKIHVVHNGCDELATTISSTQHHTKPFTFIHTGSFYRVGRNIEPLILALKNYRSEHVKILFVGDKPYKETLQLIKKENLQNMVSFIDYMPSDKVILLSAQSNALVVIQGDIFTNQIPGKVFEYMALQKPVLVITNKNSATDCITRENPNTIHANYDDISSISDGIKKIINMEVTPIERSLYSKQNTALKIEEVLLSLG